MSMKAFSCVALFCIVFLLPLTSAAKLPQKNTNVLLNAAKEDGNLAVGTPVCLDRSNVPKGELHWLYMPSTSDELATKEYLGYLSGELIKAGVVDASECPMGGLWPNGYANSCGLEKTRTVSLYLQNVYDDEIFAAGRGFGVPPIMIKRLIRFESQFWPVRIGFYHFGLGHLTYLGAQNALAWSRDLYEAVNTYSAPGTSGDMATTLLLMMDASCPTCEYKIDIPKAERSITYLAEALLGYCKQTSLVVSNATDMNAGEVVSYATIWRLTLLNYNAGPMCVYDAVRATYQARKPKPGEKYSWSLIASHLEDKSCLIGMQYVEKITSIY